MFFISIFNVITYGFYTYSFRLPLDKSIAQNYELFYRLCDMTSLFSKIVTLMGDKEAETGAVAVRSRKEGDKGAMPVAAFIDMLTDEVQKKTL